MGNFEGSLFLARSMAVMGRGLDDSDPYAFLLRITFRAFSCLLGKGPISSWVTWTSDKPSVCHGQE